MSPDSQRRRGFQERFDDVCLDTIRLGALTTEAIQGGTQALLDADLVEADRVIAADDAVDALRHRIEDECLQLLATQAPVARDLRTIVAILRIVHELERSADLMVNVAKATRRIYPAELDPVVRGIIERMGEQATRQTMVAIDAFADGDVAAGAALADMDDTMDELAKSLFRHILTDAAHHLDEGSMQWAVQITLVGRHYERIADHAVTIGERVQFMITGVHPTPDHTISLG